MVRLYIDDKEVDLFDNVRFSASYSIADIKNPFNGNSSLTKTFTIPATGRNKQIFGFVEDISATGGLDQTSIPNARLEVEGSTVIEGVFKVTSAASNNRGAITQYKGVILSGNGDWLSLISDKTLKDLDFSDYDHIYNVANIDDSEAIDSSGSSILRDDFLVYPLANYGDFTSNDLSSQTNSNALEIVRVEDRLPAFSVKRMLTEIFNSQGFTVVSDFLSTDFFKQLYIPFTGKLPLISEDEVLNRQFRATPVSNSQHHPSNYSQFFSTPQNFFSGTSSQVIIDSDTGNGNFDNGGIYDVSQSAFIPSQTGIYNFFASVDYNLIFNAVTTVDADENNTLSDLIKVEIRLMKVDASGARSIISSSTQLFDHVGDFGAILLPTSFFDNHTTDNHNLYVSANNTPISIGERVEVEVNQRGQLHYADLVTDGSWFEVLAPTPGTVFKGDGFVAVSTPTSVLGVPLGLNDVVYALKDDPTVVADWEVVKNYPPTLNIADVPVEVIVNILNSPSDDKTIFWNTPILDGLKKGDNIAISNLIPDIKQTTFLQSLKHLFNLYFYTVGRTVFIEPFDDFVTDNLVDWTGKLDHSKEIEIKFLGDTLKRNLNYKYKLDSRDKYVDNINQQRGKELASKEVEIDNLFAGEGTLDIINPLYAPTLMGFAPQINLNNNRIPKLWIENAPSGTPPEWSFDYDYRLWYYDGFQTLKSNDKWNWEGTIRTTFPRFYTIEQSEDNDNLLYFDDTNISNGLFEKHYRNYQKTINESRLLTAFFNLNDSDISNLDFRNPIQLTIDGETNVYRLNKVIDYDPTERRTVKVELLKIVADVPRATVTTIAEGGSIGAGIDAGSTQEPEEPIGIVATINGVTAPVLAFNNQGELGQIVKADTNTTSTG